MDSKAPSGSSPSHSLSNDAEKQDVKLELEQFRSVGEGDLIEMVDTTHGQFHRSFTPHQVHVCLESTHPAVMETR